MTKLIVQIPCYNEEKTLPLVVNSIPKSIEGVDTVETMIIDDGSSDNTVKVAEELGVNHIFRHKQNRGLAHTFSYGLDEALRLGADIIVNIDGDNQHPASEIPRLIQPILEGKYDIVVADRQVKNIKYFSWIKRLLQKIGSKVVRMASDTDIPDAPCGFRAYSREAALSTNIVTVFSYTMETIIQAGKKRIAITHVPIQENPKTRESRLFKSLRQHVYRSTKAILRSYAMYEPFKIFLVSGIVVFAIGTFPFFRIAYLILTSEQRVSGHVQSLILGSIFLILGFVLGMIGVVADLLSINRKLIEDMLYRLKKYTHRGDKAAQKKDGQP
jgi:glycosyltransferase involved in cell wall biosynthesis